MLHSPTHRYLQFMFAHVTWAKWNRVIISRSFIRTTRWRWIPRWISIFFIEIDSCILGGTWRELIQLSKVQLFDLPTIYVLLCPHIKINQCYTEGFCQRPRCPYCSPCRRRHTLDWRCLPEVVFDCQAWLKLNFQINQYFLMGLTHEYNPIL